MIIHHPRSFTSPQRQESAFAYAQHISNALLTGDNIKESLESLGFIVFFAAEILKDPSNPIREDRKRKVPIISNKDIGNSWYLILQRGNLLLSYITKRYFVVSIEYYSYVLLPKTQIWKKPGELFGSDWNLFHHILRFDRDLVIKKSFAQKSRWPFINKMLLMNVQSSIIYIYIICVCLFFFWRVRYEGLILVEEDVFSISCQHIKGLCIIYIYIQGPAKAWQLDGSQGAIQQPQTRFAGNRICFVSIHLQSKGNLFPKYFSPEN